MVKRHVPEVKTVGVSDIIADFIDDMLSQSDGTAELRRSELAGRFKCVPSQINYVISTRFSPERGYIVESRRGGSGYIRIRRVPMEPQMLIMHTINSLGDSVDLDTAAALIANLRCNDALTSDETELITSAIGNNALRPLPLHIRDIIRASILKQMLLACKA